jgi:hypothetical protein
MRGCIPVDSRTAQADKDLVAQYVNSSELTASTRKTCPKFRTRPLRRRSAAITAYIVAVALLDLEQL